MEMKRVFKFFSLAEYGEEQNFLEEMHQKGWKLKSYSIIKGYILRNARLRNGSINWIIVMKLRM